MALESGLEFTDVEQHLMSCLVITELSAVCVCGNHKFESDCEVMNLLAHDTRQLIVWLQRRGFREREALLCGV